MQKIHLYRYSRPDGGVTVSTVKPDTEHTELSRLVADEGYVLTNGETTTPCIDTDNPGAWSEVSDTENHNDATAEDYQEELKEFGVEV